jgi:O-antigen/teichoic acid export membrane protein
MGTYTVPRNLSLRLANSFVNPVVTRVGLPIMAKLKDDKAALKSVYLQTLRMTSSINFPVYAALAIWSNEVVTIILGGKWKAAAEFLRIFAMWGMVRSVANPLGSLLYSTGHVKPAFWWNFVMVFILPLLLWCGASADGIHGLAITMLAVQIGIFYPMYRLLVRPACGASFREYAAPLIPPFIATVAASAMALLAAAFLPSPWAFPVGIAVFGMAYLAVSASINAQWVRAMVELSEPLTRLYARGRR